MYELMTLCEEMIDVSDVYFRYWQSTKELCLTVKAFTLACVCLGVCGSSQCSSSKLFLNNGFIFYTSIAQKKHRKSA